MTFSHYCRLIVTLAFLPSIFSLLADDRSALLRLQSSLRGRTLFWNSTSAAPCSTWEGVTCDGAANRVTALRLPGDGLIGQIPANTIGILTDLRSLSLRENSLSGGIPPDIASCTQLRDLNLQGNAFSGEIPASLFSLRNLSRLSLARNNFSGNLSPSGFTNLTNLRILHLENNRFSGPLPPLNGLRNLNASFNNLTGSIPRGLARFPAQSFLGNSLCGPPLFSCPSSRGRNSLSRGAIAGIVVGSIVLLILILIALFVAWRTYRARKVLPRAADRSPLGPVTWSPNRTSVLAEANYYSSGKSFSSDPRKDRGFKSDGLVFFGENVEAFGMKALLSASAEALGQGTVGSTYKAYLDSGAEVVVKRLKNVCVSEEEFRDRVEEVGVGGPLVHENLEGVRGCFYGRDEKLLLYEPMSNGTLSALLHGNSRRPLPLEVRVDIALGIASGIEHLHSTSSTTTHGNIKSSNVFFTDEYYTPRLSEFGLTQLVSPIADISGYRAPEVNDTRRSSQEADVYSFGVLLLEVLTGKEPDRVLKEDGMGLPGWVRSIARENWKGQVFDPELLGYGNFEERIVRIMEVAFSCTDRSPNARPAMAEVAPRIREIWG